MDSAGVYSALVAFASLCISAAAGVASVDNLLHELDACRESLQQAREAIFQGDKGTYPTSCMIRNNQNASVIVQVPGHQAFPVLCDSELAGLGWLVIQRRRDGRVNFYRDWSEYKAGFGSLSGDFFIGLEKLHLLTAFQPFELYVYMRNRHGEANFAKYDEFVIGSESEKFSLKVLGSYSGTAGDGLAYHKGQAFSTFDRDNDVSRETHCAQFNLGAWWFKDCLDSHLNAQYFDYRDGSGVLGTPSDRSRHMKWGSNRDMTFVQMMIRPKFGYP